MEKNNFPVSLPGTSQKFKTGSWRFQKPKINKDLCIGCGLCEKACPENSLFVNQETKKIDYSPEFCKGCGICQEQCPKEAIKMEQE